MNSSQGDHVIAILGGGENGIGQSEAEDAGRAYPCRLVSQVSLAQVHSFGILLASGREAE